MIQLNSSPIPIVLVNVRGDHVICGILLKWLIAWSFGLTWCTTRPVCADGSTSVTATTHFEQLDPRETGIDFVHPINTAHPQAYLYAGGYASAGIAIGDVNGDDLPDLFLSGGPVKNRLYIQQKATGGQLHFQDMTTVADVDGGDVWSAGVALVDIDNDGDLDLYICNYDAPNQLFINETTAPDKIHFVEAAARFGLDLHDASFFPAFCDYDRDGDLDLYVATYEFVDPRGKPAQPPVTQQNGKYVVLPEFRKYYDIVTGPDSRPTFTNVARRDFLFQNHQRDQQHPHPRFTDVTSAAGIDGLGIGNSVTWWDFNGDGFPDLYVGNDLKGADQLWRNNGDGTFTDVIRDSFPHTTWFSMGSEAGDINNDGLIDLFISDMAGTTHYRSKVSMGEMGANREFLTTSEPRQFMRNALLINTGTPRFLEGAYLAGVANSDWTWAVKLADFDADGWLDMFITNGAARMFNHSDRHLSTREKLGKTQWDIWKDMPPRLEENLAFRNLGNLRFEDVSGAWNLQRASMSYAAAYGDLDQDGDLDLVVVNLDEPVSVYRNDTRGAHTLRLRLRGRRSNRQGIGVTVRLESAAGVQMRYLMPMMGFLSCNEPLVHFGLGNATRVDRVTLDWPSGIRQSIDTPPLDELLTIEEPDVDDARAAAPPQTPTNTVWFTRSKNFPTLRHQEQDYDDYARQPLLPYKHSQLGPGLAVGDVDGDGDDDFYLSRAKGSKRAIYFHDGHGRLSVKGIAPFATDMDYEDLGAIFFDADRDGDLDLYVVSGGVECSANDVLLRDRLYLNDGQGTFAKANAAALPDLRDSGSVVCAADFDRDGDLDLFIGSRVIPGRYPLIPNSHLLVNESTPTAPRFVDATESVAPEAGKSGLVTSAVWTDLDSDGWLDLVTTNEWGPIRFFHNENAAPPGSPINQRRLVDRSAVVGLDQWLGWWNGVVAHDFDHDGDIDILATNQGLNTTYHASPAQPELLYYGVFDDSGVPQIIEAKFEKEKCFPRRGLSCSSHAMPFVRDKVKTFHDFGLATLEDIYTPERLRQSLQLSANTLESGVFVNEQRHRERDASLPGATSQSNGAASNSDGSNLPGLACLFRFQPLPELAQISPSFGIALADFNSDGWSDVVLAQNFYSPQFETGRMDSGLSLLLQGGPPAANTGHVSLTPVWPQQSGLSIPDDAKAASVVDIDADSRPDLILTVNNGSTRAYVTSPPNATEFHQLTVRLTGPPGNPTCIGARIELRSARTNSAGQTSFDTQSAEINAGAGYLSQSTAAVTFGWPTAAQFDRLIVHWPDGTVSEYDSPLQGNKLRLSWGRT